MKIGLFLNSKKDQNEISSIIVNEAKKYSFDIDNDNPDVVFYVGGDGTFLRAIHQYMDKLESILFVGINDGTLCYFFDYTKDDIPSIFKNIVENKLTITKHNLLKGHLIYKDSEEDVYALNEIRLENPFHTLIADVFINDELLETFHGSGLVVSSTSGSSAYNKSLGGAVIDPSLNLLQLTEISTIQNNAYRSLGSSLVISGNETITLTGDFKREVVGYDYLNSENKHPLKVEITSSNKVVNIINSDNHAWIRSIKRSFVKWY